MKFKRSRPFRQHPRLPIGFSDTTEQRFWSKVDKAGAIPPHCSELGACWIWTAYCGKPFGYGRFEGFQAHRISWLLHEGSLADQVCVLHRCDNPKCVNPNHLFLGTRKDNSDDREKKGRGNHVTGERNGSSKLSRKIVQEARRLFRLGGVSMRALGRNYGVANATMRKALLGLTWRT